MKYTKVAVLLAVFALATVPMFGQVSATDTTPINVTRSESITISVTTDLPTLTIAAGAMVSDTKDVIVSSAWNLKQTRTSGVQICAYASGDLVGVSAGTTGNVDIIPVNNIYITPDGGSATALGSGTACGVAGAVQFKNYVTASAAERKNFAGQSDTIPVQVNLGATDVAADDYTGTLNLIAYSN